MSITKKLFIALLAAASLPLSAYAGPIALDIEFPEDVPGFDDRSFTLGWAFTVNEAFSVDALGVWDEDADGLNVAQTVAIWTSAGAFVASAGVDNTATAVASGFATNRAGQWLMQDVADFLLGVGDYVIGATRFGNSGDAFQFQDAVAETDARLTYTGARYSNPNSFGFPEFGFGADLGAASYFGPNFLIADDALPVPEPGTLLLFGLGLAAAGFARRRRED